MGQATDADTTSPTSTRQKGITVTWNNGDYYCASFGVHKCRRYNAKLRDHYQSIHDSIKVANAFAASGAFVAIFGEIPWLALPLSAVVALGSLLDMIFGFEKKALLHSDLNKEFSELAAKIEELEPTSKNLNRVKADRIRIESNEPHTKRLVDLMAGNEEARSRGCREDQLKPLSKWQKFFGYYFTFDMDRIEKWKRDQGECSNKCVI